jgi:hypothetical protein
MSKTKVVVIERSGVLPHIIILTDYQKVDEFTYLSSVVQADGESSREIRCHVILGREVVSRLIPI